MYDYKARVLKVVDGDTLHLEVDLGMDVRHKTTVRLYGINAPEMSTQDGRIARNVAEAWLEEHADWRPYGVESDSGDRDAEVWVRITTTKDKREKYGRYLATVLPWEVGGESLNDSLVNDGHAVPYLP